ncbi:MAG: hypothetical protein NTW38_10895 [Candidatus Aminicenantes bacterium]|nr:hypothetical protein [Candidatus Aminicenantes bacterium]
MAPSSRCSPKKMEKGYRNQLTRQIGEHLVVAKLGRMGIMATPFAGNVPDYDLLASDHSGHSMPIQVKAINGPSWQFSAKSFLNIKLTGKKQIVEGKKILRNRKLVCVLVFLRPDERDDFYILTLAHLQNHFHKNYPGGVRSKNPYSFHCAIKPEHLKAHRNKWELITCYFDPI